MAGPVGGPAWTDARSAAGGRSIWLIAAVVSIATFMEVLDVSIANVSLDHIAGSLSVSYDESTWVLTSYLIANAIAVPISGWLSNVIGRKRFYMMCVALFTVSSLACGLAQSLPALLLARIAQGLGGGGLAPSEQAILAQTFPPQKRAAAFALYGLVVIVAPILGPTLGGVITDLASWHWVFLINVPIGLLSLFLVQALMVDPPVLEAERRARLAGGLKVDGVGILLLVLWLGAQEFVLDRGQRLDWLQNPMIEVLCVVAVCAFVLLLGWEWDRETPVFDVHLLFRRSYFISVMAMLATGAIVLGTTQVIPEFLQQVMGYSASQAGYCMTLGGVVTVLMMPVAARFTGRIEPKFLMLIALGIEVGALWRFSHLTAGISWWWAAFARAAIAAGLPLLFIPINTTAYAQVPGAKVADAAAQLNLARNVGGSLAIGLAQAVLQQRTQFHQAREVERLSAADPNYRDWLQALTHAFAASGAGSPQRALAEMARIVRQQAEVSAYGDVFLLLALVALAASPMVLLIRRTKPRQA